MTEKQVEAIFGRPCSAEVPVAGEKVNLGAMRSMKTWEDGRAHCIVAFDG
jgi:hypothetical protein